MFTEIKFLEEPENAPVHLLLLADPSEEKIKTYLNKSICAVANLDGESIGAYVLLFLSKTVAEIKNIAVAEKFQGRGIGKKLLQHAIDYCRDHSIRQLKIATGNSSIGQIALYQQMGFEITTINKNYFVKHYSHPIVENGIQCKHQIVLAKYL